MTSFDDKTVEELLRVARAGLGFTLNTSTISPEDLQKITNAAAQSGAQITLVEGDQPDLNPE